MEDKAEREIRLGTLNTYQTTNKKLNFIENKISDLLSLHRLDILMLQETLIEERSFPEDSFISSNFQLLYINNYKEVGYGMAALVKTTWRSQI